jgi:transcriptional regulator with XRE-family HTH domain
VRVPRSIYSPEHRHLVELLREHREKAGVRQAELAARLDRPQSFVSKYESGQRRLDLIEVRQICTALDIDVVNLVRAWERSIRTTKHDK